MIIMEESEIREVAKKKFPFHKYGSTADNIFPFPLILYSV